MRGVVGMKPLYRVHWGTQLVESWVGLSFVYLRHKRTNTRAAVTQLLSTESTGLLWCSSTIGVQTQVFLRLKARKARWHRLEITAKLS